MTTFVFSKSGLRNGFDELSYKLQSTKLHYGNKTKRRRIMLTRKVTVFLICRNLMA